jgi:hypothetical protein
MARGRWWKGSIRRFCEVFNHKWIEDDLGHRHCERCDRREMLYENRYPDVGEPKYEWR